MSIWLSSFLTLWVGLLRMWCGHHKKVLKFTTYNSQKVSQIYKCSIAHCFLPTNDILHPYLPFSSNWVALDNVPDQNYWSWLLWVFFLWDTVKVMFFSRYGRCQASWQGFEPDLSVAGIYCFPIPILPLFHFQMLCRYHWIFSTTDLILTSLFGFIL